MLQIRIDDLESLRPRTRAALIAFLTATGSAPVEDGEPMIRELSPTVKAIDLTLGKVAEIAPHDNPAAGTVPVPSVPATPAVVPASIVPPVPQLDAAERKIDAASIGFGAKPTDAAEVPSVLVIPTLAGIGAPSPMATLPVANASSPGSAQAAIAGVPPVGVVLDSKGLPWDIRIHASTKGTNADGAWKKRKNTEPELIEEVEAELRKLMAIPATGAITVAAVPPPPPVPPVPLVPLVPGVALPPAPPVEVDPDAMPATFASLMGWVTKAVAAHLLTQAEVAQSVKPYELTSITALASRPDLIPLVYPGLLSIVQARRAGL